MRQYPSAGWHKRLWCICHSNGEDPFKEMFDQKAMQRDLVRNVDNEVLRSFNGHKVTRKRRSCNDVIKCIAIAADLRKGI